jgi:hypothetical protein
MRNAYKIFVEKPEGKRHLEDLGITREDNINMDSDETGRKGVDWIHLVQERDL